MKKFIVIACIGILSFSFFESCGSTKLVPTCSNAEKKITYAEVKPIIDTKCAKCHDQSKSETIGDFTHFNGLKKYLDNGYFEKLVFVRQSMPKDVKLSQEEINLLQCWKESGYTE